MVNYFTNLSTHNLYTLDFIISFNLDSVKNDFFLHFLHWLLCIYTYIFICHLCFFYCNMAICILVIYHLGCSYACYCLQWLFNIGDYQHLSSTACIEKNNPENTLRWAGEAVSSGSFLLRSLSAYKRAKIDVLVLSITHSKHTIKLGSPVEKISFMIPDTDPLHVRFVKIPSS